MVSLKKAALAVIAFGVTGVASAGMYTPPPAPVPACTGINVLVPCERNAWDLGIQALYVQSNSVDAVSINTLSGDIIAADTVLTNVQNFNPDWTWGFRIEGSYHFNTGGDVNLNWTHLDQDDDDNGDNNNGNDTIVVVGNNIQGRFVDNPIDSAGWDAIGTEVENKFDEVNLEYGQTVLFGEHATARFHAGLQWARIERDITQTGVIVNTSTVEDEGFFGVATSDSKFSGIGPRLGVDWAYGWNNGFALVAHTAASLLVGETDLGVTQATIDVGDDIIDNSSFASIDTNDQRQIVPGVEAKLGLAYTAAMSQGDLSIEGGYQVTHYWDAVDEGFLSSDGFIYAENDADFSFQGVYLGLKWIGNA